ncbi:MULTISPECIES: DUF2171 domain-containing protein [Methylobacterium]|uniref:DUF2171 domain-containing protein n=1 Tax=Methylobacterium TaxID=407 RepID=UPI00104FE771|nr:MULTISPECIES: DUF2171 domain-containing protein [Methylobacterium]MDR7038551.1 hypothetical protein [Methylobacterium sp. BE186]
MVDVSQIKEHADVVGSDGAHVGTVDHVEHGEIKLTRKDPDAGGLHHFIPVDFVQSIDGNTVRLDRPADEVKREWSTS